MAMCCGPKRAGVRSGGRISPRNESRRRNSNYYYNLAGLEKLVKSHGGLDNMV